MVNLYRSAPHGENPLPWNDSHRVFFVIPVKPISRIRGDVVRVGEGFHAFPTAIFRAETPASPQAPPRSDRGRITLSFKKTRLRFLNVVAALRFTSLHFASPRSTSLHFASLRFTFTSLHFASLLSIPKIYTYLMIQAMALVLCPCGRTAMVVLGVAAKERVDEARRNRRERGWKTEVDARRITLHSRTCSRYVIQRHAVTRRNAPRPETMRWHLTKPTSFNTCRYCYKAWFG